MIPIEKISKLDLDACPIILNAVFEHSSTGLAVLDLLHQYVWVNPAFAAYTGYAVDDLLGRAVPDVLGHDAWEQRRPFLEAAAEGQPVIGENFVRPLRNSKPSEDSVRTSYCPLISGNKHFGTLVLVVDHSTFVGQETEVLRQAIRERKLHERQLQDQEDRLQLALKSGRLGTWQIDLQRDELIDASVICRASFGYDADEPFGFEDILRVIHSDDLPQVLRAVSASRETGADYQVEYRCIWKDGSEHWISATAQPTFDENGKPATLIGISQDISQRKNSEREKSELLGKIREFANIQASFFRDVLASVTDGKLRLCQTVADLPSRGAQIGSSIKLSATEGLKELRKESKSAALELGFLDDRWQDLITAVSEAGMNAVVHAGGGKARVYALGGSCVQVWISDKGKGIDLENLPRATLEKGYTTTGTMGHGMKMMLQTSDRVWLLTGPAGTTVVIEQDRDSLKREWI